MEMSWHLPNNQILATEQEMIEQREVNGNQAGNNMEMIDMNHQDVLGNSSPIKRRKKQSKVWEEMTKFTGADGKDCARCNHCQKVFDGSSKKGTTHLNNHLQRCPRKRNNGAGDNADKPMDSTTNLTSPVVIEEKSVIDLIKSCFDEDGELTENWDPSVLNSRKVEILQIYEEQKEELRRIFSQLSCRLSLVIEMYFGYYLLSAYYIDNSWERKVKIFRICAANKDEDVHHLAKLLKESCLDLKIDGNICSIIYHNHKTSHFVKGDHEDVIEEINSRFNQRGIPLHFIEFLFSVDMLFHNFEDDLTQWLWKTFSGIRKCIDYVNSTQSNMHNFQIAIDKAMGKKVNTSDPFQRDDDSFYSFQRAMGYKEAFCQLEQMDFDFKSRSINLTVNLWDEATVIYEHYKELSDSVDSLVKNEYTTLNQYFPKFCDVYMKLLALLERIRNHHLDRKTPTLIENLTSALEKYNLVLVIAVVLDPRFKMNIVQLWYNKIYGGDADCYLEKIKDDFTTVYNKYHEKASEPEDTISTYLDGMGRPSTSTPKSSSELERYLNDPKVPSVEIFDILAWWRACAPIFPTLALMARDFLALPISVHQHFLFIRLNYITCIDIFDCKNLDDDIKPAFCYLTECLKVMKNK
ncbi:Zinc finger BED domain-containing protein [Melia azedarach]|uniref:Zinc finger BED domain-containing protein n=1 Tax=Melia azedarach TaxID=155640 RepID=A0ACC1YKB4_MELAZ|nr:Zinc finger BED domain-containing protein [Melia azedarach]